MTTIAQPVLLLGLMTTLAGTGALVATASTAGGRLVKLTPKNQEEHAFPVSWTRAADGATTVEFPVKSSRYDLYEVQLVLRREGVDDNLVVARLAVPVQHQPATDKGRRKVAFSLGDEVLGSTGLLLRYGSREQEDIYSLVASDWVAARR